MYYLWLLIIALGAFLVLCLTIRLLGEGKREKAKGGPVIRSRQRRGIVRFSEDPNDSQENFARILR